MADIKNALEGFHLLLDSHFVNENKQKDENKDNSNQNQISIMDKILQGKSTVALGGHLRPDGDCVGSCVGLFLYIKKNFPQIAVDIYLEPIPSTFFMLAGTKEIKNQVEVGTPKYLDKGESGETTLVEETASEELEPCGDGSFSYDLFITLDCAEKERLGFALPIFNNAKSTLCIDHHISNTGFADLNYIVPEASSTCELVYSLLEDELINKEIADALFMGIIHDTGVFRFSNTQPTTLQVAAALLAKGVNSDEIIEKTFYERTFLQTKIVGKALWESKLILDNQGILYVLTKKEMDENNVSGGDLDGIVSQLWLTKDIEVAIFIYELEPGTFKVSLRSSDQVDVSAIAKKFGGGGHKKAAGFEMKESSKVIVELVSKEVKGFLS
jgi:phosphoesterase RecJ-like protein